MELGLKGKKAVVTGGATGLGKQFVLALTNEGVDVAFSFYSENEHPEQVVEEVEKNGKANAFPLKTDLSNVEDAMKFFDEAHEKLGQVDILVNNAGVWLTGKVTEISASDWDRQLNTNLRAPFLMMKKFAQYAHEENHGGHVLNVTSQAAYYGSTTGHAHYAASKGGLLSLNASFAREEAKNGINSNNIIIGIMHTRMIQANLDKDPNYYVNRIPVGRVVEPDEVAKMGILLVSDVYSYATGASFDLTGGMIMH